MNVMNLQTYLFRRVSYWTGLCILIVLFTAAVRGDDPLPELVEFNRDIRPILSDACFHCHGPDQAKRQADLRLDREESALAAHDGRRPLVPRDLQASVLYQRITSTDADLQMPPPDSGHTLTRRQIELIRKWIEQGVVWQKHWSFLPPRRPEVPTVQHANAVRNPIDAFVLAQLERKGLKPSEEADRNTLLRRVTLDLTGLPPTPDEVDAFLADNSPQAYETVVDRLLQSPRYGERMAMRWLDAARYADTSGYQTDGERTMWRWRDWVIAAYNDNMPFDRFTIEQLAGDLLPQPTMDQRIATAFNRNHRGNAEGGIIPEEYAVEYVVDRVETTWTVWLGLTMGCARCHDHKFDPLSQRDFYQQFAFFNNVPEQGRAVKYGNSPPLIKSPTLDEQAHLHAVDARLADAQKRWNELATSLTATQSAWEAATIPDSLADWSVEGDVIAHFDLNENLSNLITKPQPAPKSAPALLVDFAASSSTTNGATSKMVGGDPEFSRGPLAGALDLNGTQFVDAGNVAELGFYDKFTLAAWIRSTDVSRGSILSRMTSEEQGSGYSLALSQGHLQLNLSSRWLDDALRVEAATTLSAGEWHHVCVTYDGSRVASGIRLYVDGVLQPLTILLDELNQTFANKEPFRIGAGGSADQNYRGLIDEIRVYTRVLSPDEVEALATPDSIPGILTLPSAKRTPAQARKLQLYYLEQQAPESLRTTRKALRTLQKERDELIESFPTTMVMEELPTPRETYVLIRGEYNKPGERVMPGVPASLSPWPDGLRTDRLGLATWLMSPENPLTARVAVNRFWQMYFGNGIVKTIEDFGSQGDWPSHPELLDWLAAEFRESGWNIKNLQKLIVMSATYRQSSKFTPLLLQIDPENIWLARGPRLRLSAETIRDQALFSSGLLVEQLGGPSVMPYQPGGLWEELSATPYVQGKGVNLYRRSMYTFWKRTVTPPSMLAFDASTREACTVRETRTNTPLQALTLLNDKTFVEAARVLAQRVLHAETDPQRRLDLAFKLVLGRVPRPREREILAAGLIAYRARFESDESAARKLVSTGESPCPPQLDIRELAAYATLAGLILNLDEAIVKE